MDKIEVKKIIKNRNISGKIKKTEELFLLEIIEMLDANSFSNAEFTFRGFESSFVESKPNVRLLHLEFPKIGLGKAKKIKISRMREQKIVNVMSAMEAYFGCKYNLNLCQKIFKFNKKNGTFPIQIGLEFERNQKPKIKIYLSVNSAAFSLGLFLRVSEVDNQLDITRRFENSKFDTVAVDFLPGSEFSLKLYPLTAENRGLLVRISREGKIFSRKAWVRFPGGLSAENFAGNEFFNFNLLLHDYIKQAKLKVFYLCLEGSRKSLYFR